MYCPKLDVTLVPRDRGKDFSDPVARTALLVDADSLSGDNITLAPFTSVPDSQMVLNTTALCRNIEFWSTPHLASSDDVTTCTAFFVSRHMLLTARHCIPEAATSDEFSKLVALRGYFGVRGNTHKVEPVSLQGWTCHSERGYCYGSGENDDFGADVVLFVHPDLGERGVPPDDLFEIHEAAAPLNEVTSLMHTHALPMLEHAQTEISQTQDFGVYCAGLDSGYGASGAPIFNQDGRLFGVNLGPTRSWIKDAKKKCLHGSFGSGLSKACGGGTRVSDLTRLPDTAKRLLGL